MSDNDYGTWELMACDKSILHDSVKERFKKSWYKHSTQFTQEKEESSRSLADTHYIYEILLILAWSVLKECIREYADAVQAPLPLNSSSCHVT